MLVITPIFCALNPLNQSDLALVKCKWVIFMSLLLCSWNLIFFQVGHLLVSIDFHLLCQSYLQKNTEKWIGTDLEIKRIIQDNLTKLQTDWPTFLWFVCPEKEYSLQKCLDRVCTYCLWNTCLSLDSVFNQLCLLHD